MKDNLKSEIDSSLLFEIGTEEIPARFFPGAFSDLKEIAINIFDEYRIEYKEIKTYATPRRLVLMIDSITSVQKSAVKKVFGPPKKAAFDDQENPTKAATGFANSLGIEVSDLSIEQKGKGEYIAATIKEKGAETKIVLPEVLKKIIRSLHFPRTMRWGDGRLSFVRPIHWIMAIFGSEIIDIEFDGIKSSNMTRGHRFLSPAPFRIKENSSYMDLLKNNFVILDHKKRKELIREGIAGVCCNSDRQPIIDEELLDTVNFLVEFPVPVLCSFSAEYLKLPKELLITVMRDHQKYFAVQDSKDDLLNNFIVISNTKAENAETVRIGAERVIKARFDDARFYFQEDLKKPLIDRVENLKQVTFHDKLGTLFEKTERLTSIAAALSEKLNSHLKDKLTRAALLSKTDLITGVVREFPELQGVMGKYYAHRNGEESKVSVAIGEQYLPQSLGGRLPETDIGAILSLSDKTDNIASFFSIGLVPTGSEDPFALRRQAMGIVSIIIDRGYAITLGEIFDLALRNLPDIPNSKSNANNLRNIISFMEQRIEFILSSEGYAPDLIKSVLSLSSIYPLKTIIARINAVKKFKTEDAFTEFLLAIKRVYNILPKTPLPMVRTNLLLQDGEKDLYHHISRLRNTVARNIEEERFYESLKIFSEITAPVNNFFDGVLVMDKQEEIKANRLALLKEVWTTASLLTDFSKLL